MKHKVSPEELEPAVEEALKAGQCVVDAIARKLGYSTTTIKKRLEQLELAGRAHRARIPGRLGLAYRWHPGPSPDAAPSSVHVAPALPYGKQGSTPFQYTIRTYPAIDRRDPLVAALFGPARKRAL